MRRCRRRITTSGACSWTCRPRHCLVPAIRVCLPVAALCGSTPRRSLHARSEVPGQGGEDARGQRPAKSPAQQRRKWIWVPRDRGRPAVREPDRAWRRAASPRSCGAVRPVGALSFWREDRADARLLSTNCGRPGLRLKCGLLRSVDGLPFCAQLIACFPALELLRVTWFSSGLVHGSWIG